MSVPPRTSSAPIVNGQAKFQLPHHMHHHHAQHHVQGLPSRVPAGPPTPPPAVTVRSKTPSPQPEAVPFDDHPPDLIYDVNLMIKFADHVADLPPSIHKFGMEQWATVPDLERPEHMSTGRVGFFGDHVASMPNRLIQHRKLHNEVMGIMSRVGPQNYEAMRNELLQLPIRQSDEEDIQQVIDSFFRKSIRPEDAPYTEYYVNLIRDLIEDMGRKDPVGISIRQKILKKCQEVFESVSLSTPDPAERLDDPDEEEIRQKQLRDKGKANIKLLGLLFNNRIVNEKIPQTVLYNLLFGQKKEDDSKRHRNMPSDHDIDLFVDLLTKIAKNVTDITSRYFDVFFKSLFKLSTEHPSRRIQFKLIDFLDLMKRDFNPVGSTAMKHYDTKAEVVEMSFQTFRDILDTAIKEPHAEREQEILTVQSKKKSEHIQQWLITRITSVNRVQERTCAGELFGRLLNEGIFTKEEVQASINGLLPQIVDSVDDNPRIFENWAELVLGGRETFHLGLHSLLLRLLADSPMTTSNSVLKMIRDVEAKMPQFNPEPNPPYFLNHHRFRVLPTLLRIPPQVDDADDADEKTLQEPMDSIESLSGLQEVLYYSALKSGEANTHLLNRLHKLQTRTPSPSLMMQIVCAIFCFVRFDLSVVTSRKLDEYLSKLRERTALSAIHCELVIMSEIHATWVDLDRCPFSSFGSFLTLLKSSKVISSQSMSQFKGDLNDCFPEDARFIPI